MRRHLFEVLTVLLIGGSLVFFYECVTYLAQRQYVSALVLCGIGISVISVGKELARLALVQKD
jgi:uncharacterized membrane protein YczE